MANTILWIDYYTIISISIIGTSSELHRKIIGIMIGMIIRQIIGQIIGLISDSHVTAKVALLGFHSYLCTRIDGELFHVAIDCHFDLPLVVTNSTQKCLLLIG